MDEEAKIPAARSAWAPLLTGLRRHGAIGKLYVLLQTAVAALVVFLFVAGLAPDFLAGLRLLAIGAVHAALAVGVALHRRLAVIAAFALSVFACVSALYAATQYLRHLSVLAVALGLAALYGAFAWYFGRLQRVAVDQTLESAPTTQSGSDSAA